ncbi:uncharacterized protein LOC127122149 [Lathyrus oleraceus]|uniref:uncharacterized protein LOC127122149 n=1 Tax=Pisum sativum TaxID=3888 RepID=UPI0021D271D6|nr:uncharacterized protein LOC127122149 [Pisum sativum]
MATSSKAPKEVSIATKTTTAKIKAPKKILELPPLTTLSAQITEKTKKVLTRLSKKYKLFKITLKLPIGLMILVEPSVKQLSRSKKMESLKIPSYVPHEKRYEMTFELFPLKFPPLPNADFGVAFAPPFPDWVPPKKPTIRRPVESKTEGGCSKTSSNSHQNPKTHRDPVIIEYNKKDLSPVLDLTSRKRKQQPNISDALSQPPTKLPKKRPSTLIIQEPTPEEMAKIAAAQSESDNSSPGIEGDKGGPSTFIRTKAITSSPPASIADVLNSDGEPTYRPSSEKNSMSKINQPLSGGLDTSPSKTATQHSHTNDSDHETALIEEDEVGVNPDTMVVDEGVQAGDNPGDDSYNVKGTVNPQEEGGNGEDTVMEEENKGNHTPVPVGDDGEGSEEREADTGEMQAQSQTLVTPTIAVIPTGRVSTSSIRGLSA